MQAFLVGTNVSDQEDAVARLWDLGTSGIEERASSGERVSFISYFEDGVADTLAVRQALQGLEAVSVEPSAIPDVDWVARFRENFRAFGVGGFWIRPEWDHEPSPGGLRVLTVDPGRAFGTGTHESTALCLLSLETLAAAAPLGRVADVGTGSGILAIAARQLGAAQAVASDIDPDAIDEARRHAILNDTSIHLLRGDGARALAPAGFDTVVANITGPLLIERASELRAAARPGGVLVLAGLLDEESADVTAAFGLPQGTTRRLRGEWASLTVRIP